MVTDKLDTALEDDGADGYQYTELALENGPGGGGSTDVNVVNVNGVAVTSIDDFKADTSNLATSTEVSDLDTKIDVVDTVVDNIYVDTQRVDGLLEDDGSGNDRLTEKALEEGPVADTTGLSTFDPDSDVLENSKTFSQIFRGIKAFLMGNTTNGGLTVLADDGTTTRGTITISDSNRTINISNLDD